MLVPGEMRKINMLRYLVKSDERIKLVIGVGNISRWRKNKVGNLT